MSTATTPRETSAVLRYYRASAFKARPVLDLIRGKSVAEARAILSLSTRGFAEPILKLLNSAVANAEHNDQLPADELFVAVAMADEGPTMRRFRARARGRGSRIRKRTCHITITVRRYSDEQIERQEKAQATTGGASRARRVAQSRAAAGKPEAAAPAAATEEVLEDETSVPETEAVVDSTEATEATEATEESTDEAAEAVAATEDAPEAADDASQADASEEAATESTDDETKDA